MRCNKYLIFFGVGLLCLLCSVSSASAKNLPQSGDRIAGLMEFAFNAPVAEEHRTYLNIAAGQDSVVLGSLDKPYLLVEIVGVYCPVCHTQAADMVRLFQRVQRDGALADKLGFIAVAAGATPMEVEHLQKTWRFPFPILQDGDYVLHKMLGEPDTPFTFLVDPEGLVLHAHLGRIDPTSLFNQLKKLLP